MKGKPIRAFNGSLFMQKSNIGCTSNRTLHAPARLSLPFTVLNDTTWPSRSLFSVINNTSVVCVFVRLVGARQESPFPPQRIHGKDLDKRLKRIPFGVVLDAIERNKTREML